MKKILTVVCVIAMMLSLSIVAGAEENKVITITTAEELAGMSDDLTADYVLDADIDLAGIVWTPIGTYKPSGESEEEQEIPASDTAFTGTFDGQGHIIRNSSAEKADDETSAAAEKLLEDVSGTYDALFPVITSPEYDQIWLDSCAAVLGDEAAPAAAEALKAACNGTIYGQEAIDAYGDGSNGAQFDCLFINGVNNITFAVYRSSRRAYYSSDKTVTDRNRCNSACCFNNSAFANFCVISKNYDPYIIFFQIHCDTESRITVFKLHQLIGHYVAQSVNSCNSVTNFQNASDIRNFCV